MKQGSNHLRYNKMLSSSVVFKGCLLAQVQQESPAKKPHLHCDVDNNLITSTTPNTNTPRKAISRVGRRGSLNGRE